MERKFYDPEYDRVVDESVPKNSMHGSVRSRGFINPMMTF